MNGWREEEGEECLEKLEASSRRKQRMLFLRVKSWRRMRRSLTRKLRALRRKCYSRERERKSRVEQVKVRRIDSRLVVMVKEEIVQVLRLPCLKVWYGEPKLLKTLIGQSERQQNSR